MEKIGNRFFTDKSKVVVNNFYTTVSSNTLKSLINSSYTLFFNTPQSFVIKNNIYKFNSCLKSKILLMSIANILEEKNIVFNYNINNTNPIIEINNIKFAILDSGSNDLVSLIDTTLLENNPILFNCDYFIFVKVNNNFNLINMNINSDKLKDFDYIEELILNRNISTNIIGILEKDDLMLSLTNKNIIPSKTILDNKIVIANPSYFIYNIKLKNIAIVLDKFKNTPSEESFYMINEDYLDDDSLSFMDSKSCDFESNLDIDENEFSNNVENEIGVQYKNYVSKESSSFLKNFFISQKKN